MDTVPISGRAGMPRALATFLFHHNPFYLLSALCMIAGCYLLNDDLGLRVGELPRLLLLEAPFLVDLAFLNAEMAQTHGATALLLNGLVFCAALLKVAVIFRVLYVEFPSRIFRFVAAELLVLFALPSVLKAVAHHGSLTPGQFYMAWLVVALLPVMYESQTWLADRLPKQNPTVPQVPRRRFILHLYMTLPFVSLLAHLGMLHWVYCSRYYLGEGALVLLGISFPLARLKATDPRARSLVAALRFALPAMAIAMTLMDPVPVALQVGGRTPLTPAMLIAGGAYVYTYLRKHAIYYIAAAVSSGGMALFLQWGVAAVAAGFAFLGLGASISLRQPPVAAPPIGEGS
jgi:hypothetical protein